MRQIFGIAILSAIMLSGCATTNNELLQAIDDSYSMDSGKIISKYKYETSYDNLELGGEVKGTIAMSYSSPFDLIEGNIAFADTNQKFKYYVSEDNNVYSLENNKLQEKAMLPLYTNEPNLHKYQKKIPKPTTKTVTVAGEKYECDMYVIEASEQVDTKLVNALFETVIKLGLVGSDVLTADTISGNFSFTFYVDQSSGKLIKEIVTYQNQEEEGLASQIKVEIETSFDYSKQQFEVPSELEELS